MEVTETVEQTTAAPEVAAPEQTAAPEVQPVSTSDAIQANAEKAIKAREENPGKVPDPAAPAPFQANFKYKVMDKDHEIPEEFRGLMKDAESEKKVREIFEKATGLDVVKENLATARTDRDQARKQYAEINGQISDLRQTFQAAVKSGDLLKLDAFWKKLDISQDTIMQYALAKVRLHEMPEEQRNAILQKQNAETEAEQIRRQQAEISQGYMEQRQVLKQLQLERAYATAENIAAANDFDGKFGRPGAFREEVRRWGEQEWFRSNGQVDLTPEQAIAAVIKHYNLKTDATQAPPAPQAPVQSQDPRQNVIVKKTPTIPNLGSGGSQSPLKSKPKSIDDLKKLASQAANGEAI